MDNIKPGQTESKASQIFKRELERRSQDIIKVHNILNEDIAVTWDGFHFNVPGANKNIGQDNGNQLLPRYIAMNYMKKIIDRVLTERADAHILTENTKRIKQGRGPMNPQEREIMETPLRIDIPANRLEVMKQVWLGVAEEYGKLDIAQPQQSSKPADPRPLDDQLLDQIEKPTPIANIMEDMTGSSENVSKEDIIE